ncbi:MAG: hypothetical protein RIS88_1353 [Pseudomonadota bacterium]
MNTHALPRAVALVDARYLRWLARLDDPDGAAAAALPRDRVVDSFQQLLARSGLRSHLLRTYWYADVDDQAVFDDQSLRLVPAADTDGNALVRQMASDLQALAASGRIDIVVIASDDDRLCAPMEAAKMAGLTVCLLADERAESMPRLMQQDPNWARLLREADRRLVMRSSDLAQAMGPGGASAAASATPVPDEDLEATMQAVVNTWWEDLPQDERVSLRDELPALRGVPPEVDRELLLRGKNALNRSLNFHEKRVLREHARQVAMA